MNAVTILFLYIIIAFLTAWAPIKPLAYIAPVSFLFFLIVFYKGENYLITIRRLIAVLLICILVYSIFLVLRRDVSIQNMILAFFTSSWLISVLVLPIDKENSSELYAKYLKIGIPIFILQVIIGFIQAITGFLSGGSFDLSNGDRVEGTIHIALNSSGSFSNVIFEYNVIGLILIILPYAFEKKRKLIPFIFFAAIVVLMASVVHLILFIALAVGLSFIIHRPKFDLGGKVWKWAARVSVISLPLIAVSLLATNLSNISSLSSKLVEFENPKSKVYKNLFTEMPSEFYLMPFIGLGPGQFSSRASLIGSEYYFGGIQNPIDLPVIEQEISAATNKYIMPKWIWISELPFSAGSTLHPFSSWITIIGEYGLLFFIIIGIIFFRKIFRIRRNITNYQKLVNFSISAFWIFFFISGFQENYWEVPQMFLSSLLGILIMEKLNEK